MSMTARCSARRSPRRTDCRSDASRTCWSGDELRCPPAARSIAFRQPAEQIGRAHLAALEHDFHPVQIPRLVDVRAAQRDAGREMADERQAPDVERAQDPARRVAARDAEAAQLGRSTRGGQRTRPSACAIVDGRQRLVALSSSSGVVCAIDAVARAEQLATPAVSAPPDSPVAARQQHRHRRHAREVVAASICRRVTGDRLPAITKHRAFRRADARRCRPTPRRRRSRASARTAPA